MRTSNVEKTFGEALAKGPGKLVSPLALLEWSTWERLHARAHTAHSKKLG